MDDTPSSLSRRRRRDPSLPAALETNCLLPFRGFPGLMQRADLVESGFTISINPALSEQNLFEFRNNERLRDLYLSAGGESERQY